MCDFRPGDHVVCVNNGWLFDFPRHLRRAPDLVKGALYTVLWANGTVVSVLESDPGLGYYAYSSRRFRKVQRRKTDLSIESFLTIKPGFEEPRRVTTPTRKKETAR